MSAPSYMPPIQFRQSWDTDPADEDKEYYLNHWFQAMIPVRTRCYICKKDSPEVHVPWGDVLAFGNPRMLRRSGHKLRDMTADVVRAFAQINWKFQLRRSYCPTCKGLGRV